MNKSYNQGEKALNKAFLDHKAFIGFLTAGDPSEESCVEYILTMAKAGADIIEIGIPFSDPTAEGPIIEKANVRALKAGMNVDGVFRIVSKVRESTMIPLVFLTYLNPVFHYGYEEFFQKCKECKVDGIIIPDLPFEECDEVLTYSKKNQVTLISLIAPTSKQRMVTIAKEAKGFVYVVSSLGVTGVRSELTSDLSKMVQVIKENTSTPCAIGFGIHTPEQAGEIVAYADGVIVGSAIVKIIEEHQTKAGPYLHEYVEKMKNRILENK